jgi:hypothetical protein
MPWYGLAYPEKFNYNFLIRNIMFEGLIAALLIAFLSTAIASLIFKRKGPWGTVWTFFLFLFLVLWTVAIYVKNTGPVYWGIAWLPLLFAAVVLALLLASIIPNVNQWRDESLENSETNNVKTPDEIRDASQPRTGSLFWLMIVILITAIVLGMANPQMAL